MRELASSTIISTMKATTCSTIRLKMILATSLTAVSDSSATITITIRLIPKIAPSLVR